MPRLEHATAIHHVQEGENQGYLVVESRGVAIHHHAIAHRGGILHTERYPAHGERHHENGEEPSRRVLRFKRVNSRRIDFLSTTVGLDDEVIACIGNLPFRYLRGGNLLWVIIDKGGASCQGNRGGIYALKGIELRSTLAEHTEHAIPITGIVFFIVFPYFTYNICMQP